MNKQEQKAKATRVRAYGALFAVLTGLLLIAGAVLYFKRDSSGSSKVKAQEQGKQKGKAKRKGDGAGGGKVFEGGTYEASDVIHVPDTNGVLFVDDSRPTEVFWMRLDESGNQVGPIKPVPLGMTVPNPEAITFDGAYYYVSGSQSGMKTADKAGMARFTFDPNTQTAGKAEAIIDLRGFLIKNVPELQGEGAKTGRDDGLNIEGLAWDAARRWLLLGLRSPLVDNQALVVALKMRDPQGPFSYDNLSLAEPRAMRLALGGQGIRSIQYDGRLKTFLVISGATEQGEKTDFKVFEWSGDPTQSTPRERTTLDKKLKPEGITRVKMEGGDFIFVVCDASSYMKIED